MDSHALSFKNGLDSHAIKDKQHKAKEERRDRTTASRFHSCFTLAALRSDLSETRAPRKQRPCSQQQSRYYTYKKNNAVLQGLPSHGMAGQPRPWLRSLKSRPIPLCHPRSIHKKRNHRRGLRSEEARKNRWERFVFDRRIIVPFIDM